MPSSPIRIAFTATSLAPVLLVYAALFLFDGDPLFAWSANRVWAIGCLLAIAACLYACHRILRFYSERVSSGPKKFDSLKVADKSAIAFVVVYSLPLITRQDMEIRIGALIVLFALLGVLIYHSDAYLINPLLTLPPFRYHFYEVTTKEEVTYVLVSKREILELPRYDGHVYITLL
jgi:hypothetical protein